MMGEQYSQSYNDLRQVALADGRLQETDCPGGFGCSSSWCSWELWVLLGVGGGAVLLGCCILERRRRIAAREAGGHPSNSRHVVLKEDGDSEAELATTASF